ncbi:uncharacterized protein [Coffea arabica]|uniref:Uncharacterized protein isoform X1 n=1 Tax=Coffea arabica TaxID=13443 RepID=A0A6P6UE14_COFAR|nr:zinc finger protein CONSTANS isoform X1 [Coffea arabica]
MYAHSNANIPATNEIPCVYSPPSSSTPEFFGHFSASSLPAPLAIPVNEYESSCALKSEFSYTSTSSGCSSYSSPTSLTSYATTNYNSSYYSSPTSLTSYESNYNANLMQRSISSHSLLHRNNVEGFSALVSSPTACYDSETSPFRKVFSAGDLEQGMTPKQHSRLADSSLANEYSIIESMSKACRYSPEEKKERIERYRSKRNLRNFNKKIKYECRKTLADSRPRIRGRFARNDEIEKASQNQWDQAGIEEEDEDDDNWINILDTFSTTLIP